jgi:hypothetical protein
LKASPGCLRRQWSCKVRRPPSMRLGRANRPSRRWDLAAFMMKDGVTASPCSGALEGSSWSRHDDCGAARGCGEAMDSGHLKVASSSSITGFCPGLQCSCTGQACRAIMARAAAFVATLKGTAPGSAGILFAATTAGGVDTGRGTGRLRKSCATTPAPASGLLRRPLFVVKLLHHRLQFVVKLLHHRQRLVRRLLLRRLCSLPLPCRRSGCLGLAIRRQGRRRSRSASTPPQRCCKRPPC